MALQFYCPGCSEPIEVDDDLAGQTAGCPYCRQVVTVPLTSTYLRGSPPTARPAAPAPAADGHSTAAPLDAYRPPADHGWPGQAEAAPPAAPAAAARRAVALGNGALICLVLTVACACALMAIAFTLLPPLPAIPPGADSATIVREWQQEALERAAENPNAAMLNLVSLPLLCGMPLLALLALGFGVMSLAHSGGREWRGWVGVIGSVLLGCVVGTVLMVGVSMQSAGGS